MTLIKQINNKRSFGEQTCDKGLVPVKAQIIGVKSWIDKDYIIKIEFNPDRVKFQIRKSNIGKTFFAGNVTLDDLHVSIFFILLRRFIYPRMQRQWLFISDRCFFMAYDQDKSIKFLHNIIFSNIYHAYYHFTKCL